MKAAFLVAIIGFIATAMAHADQWPAPVVRGAISHDGKIAVRVHPGDSLGDVFGFAGAKKGRYARALVFVAEGEDRYKKIREIELLNPIAPMEFVVSNAGEIVTLDNWHNMGMGQVVVVYGPDGKVRKSHTLADIYSRSEVGKFQASVSSIWWRCTQPPFLERGASTLMLADKLGNRLDVDLATGAVLKSASGKAC